jgi:hypothetical protein
LRRWCYFILFIDVHLRSEEQVSRIVVLSDPALGEVNKISGSDIHDCSLASSSSSPQLVYLFVGRAPRVIAFNTNFITPIVIFI